MDNVARVSLKVDSILVIDDDEMARRVLVTILTREGVTRIEQATSAEEVEEKLKQEKFSLIVSDYHLGGASGVDLLEKIRKDGNRTPVLLISGIPNLSGVVRASIQDRVDFMSKPFKIHELVGAVERLLAS